MSTWESYYEKNKDRPLRDFYLKAITLAPNGDSLSALDLGCGVGTEAIDLLSRGYIVHAVDPENSALKMVKASPALLTDTLARLITHHTRAEDFHPWPPVDFFYAFHSFPFCEPEKLDEVIQLAIASVKNGGIFAASFFGTEDEWVREKKASGIGASSLRSWLSDFDLLHFEESSKLGPTALAGDKHWHLIEIIAKKHPKSLA